MTLPPSMQAVVIDRFGGADELHLARLPIPVLEPDEVLLRVEVAGVGVWDPFEREGGYRDALPRAPRFPYVLGSEGAGTIAAVGADVKGFSPGERVLAVSFLNAKGGFYAEYAAVPAELVASVPPGLTVLQAGVLGGAVTTALRGLQDVLQLERGETLLVFGASGGVGHAAVQLGKLLGAHVFAVASRADGVELARRAGTDGSVDGHAAGALEAASAFASQGFDAALVVGSSELARGLAGLVRAGGRLAFPNGVLPAPEPRASIRVTAYNGEPDAELLARSIATIARGPFFVHVARTFALADAARAHAALGEHHLGKLALVVQGR